MSLLIKNGKIVTADSTHVADIWCEQETITRIEKNITPPPQAEVIDATGKLVFPGFIDPHTHVYLPAMGTFAKDNYETATIAALCGGTTTIFDFATPERRELPMQALETWLGKARDLACSDYAMHLCITRFDAEVEKQLHEVMAQGIPSFKIYLAYKGALSIDDQEIYQALRFAKENGALIAAHCENADVIVERQKELIAAHKTGPEYHYESRPPAVEADGTGHFCAMAALLQVPVYIVHLSCEEALRVACEAKLRGTSVWIETLITYLLLDKTYAERPNFEGAKYIASPPLREKKNQEVLWHALQSGLIATVGSDHAPFDTTQKRMGKDNFSRIPNGMPPLEDRVRMLYTYGVCQGRLDISRFVDIASTQVAKIFGLFPRKGTIQVGSDADLVVYDPDYQDTITAKKHHMNIDYNVFEGFAVKGRCAAVTVRGNVQVRNGEFVGKKGIGQFLRRGLLQKEVYACQSK